MQDARIRIALIVICLACLLGSGFVLVKGHQSAPPPIVLAPPPLETKPSEPSGTAPAAAVSHHAHLIYVDVAGAVRRPSLYVLRPDSRVMQAIMAAGGPTDAADMDAVNLAQAVTDGEKIFVPKRGPAAVNLPSSPPPTAPTSALKPPMLSPVKTSKGSNSKSSAGKSSGGSRSGKISADTGEMIGLNSATLEQLERLPGVGPGMAARILAYRDQAGGFSKIEDLTLVTGIGPKKFTKIAPFVTLD
jgi:competence protein ComEA